MAMVEPQGGGSRRGDLALVPPWIFIAAANAVDLLASSTPNLASTIDSANSCFTNSPVWYSAYANKIASQSPTAEKAVSLLASLLTAVPYFAHGYRLPPAQRAQPPRAAAAETAVTSPP